MVESRILEVSTLIRASTYTAGASPIWVVSPKPRSKSSILLLFSMLGGYVRDPADPGEQNVYVGDAQKPHQAHKGVRLSFMLNV